MKDKFNEQIKLAILSYIGLLDEDSRRYIKEHIWLPEDGEDMFRKKLLIKENNYENKGG